MRWRGEKIAELSTKAILHNFLPCNVITPRFYSVETVLRWSCAERMLQLFFFCDHGVLWVKKKMSWLNLVLPLPCLLHQASEDVSRVEKVTQLKKIKPHSSYCLAKNHVSFIWPAWPSTDLPIMPTKYSALGRVLGRCNMGSKDTLLFFLSISGGHRKNCQGHRGRREKEKQGSWESSVWTNKKSQLFISTSSWQRSIDSVWRGVLRWTKSEFLLQ